MGAADFVPQTADRLWSSEQLLDATLTVAHPQFLPLLEKLNHGEPITVLAFGSSITGDLGGCFHTNITNVTGVIKHVPTAYLDGK